MTKLQLWIAGVLAVVILVVAGYCAGMKRGAQNEKLAQNTVATKANDATTKTDSLKADTATKAVAHLDSTHSVIRPKVIVKHDTVTVDSSHVYVDSTLAQLIVADDSLIAAQKKALALKDTLIASLYVGQKLRDERIKILESVKTPRFSKGIQVGIGVCQSLDLVRRPCVYAGYGVEMRMP